MEPVVDGDGHQTAGETAADRLDYLGAVGQHQRHSVTLAEAPGQESGAERQAALGELAVGERALLPRQGDSLAIVYRLLGQERGRVHRWAVRLNHGAGARSSRVTS